MDKLLIASLMFLFIMACDKNDSEVDVVSAITNKEWETTSHNLLNGDKFTEIILKSTYRFFPEGTYEVKSPHYTWSWPDSTIVVADSTSLIEIDTAYSKGDWVFDDTNNLIDFIGYDTLFRGRLTDSTSYTDTLVSDKADWKVVTVSSSTMLVEIISQGTQTGSFLQLTGK